MLRTLALLSLLGLYSKTAVRKTPQESADKWKTNLSAATPAITAGVNRVTEAPGQKAAANVTGYVRGVQEKANKWRNNVGRVSLQEWQQSMTKLGIPRIAQGAAEKQGKWESFAAEVFPYMDRGLQQLSAMDSSSTAARIQKAVAWMNYMHGFQRGSGARPAGA